MRKLFEAPCFIISLTFIFSISLVTLSYGAQETVGIPSRPGSAGFEFWKNQQNPFISGKNWNTVPEWAKRKGPGIPTSNTGRSFVEGLKNNPIDTSSPTFIKPEDTLTAEQKAVHKNLKEMGYRKFGKVAPVQPKPPVQTPGVSPGSSTGETFVEGLKKNPFDRTPPVKPQGVKASPSYLGKVLVIIGAIWSGYNISTSDNPKQQAKEEAGGWLGGAAGGLVTGGPVGAIIGAIIGGIMTSSNAANTIMGNDQDYQNQKAMGQAGPKLVEGIKKRDRDNINKGLQIIRDSGMPFEPPQTGTAGGTADVYNPLDDPNRTSKDKPVDVAGADDVGKKFQDSVVKGKGDKKPLDQPVTQQSDGYTKAGTSSGEKTTGDQTQQQAPYGPNPPPGPGRNPAKDARDVVSGLPPPRDPHKDSTGKKTTPGKTTSGSTTAGIEVKVVGKAPPGKCTIVDGLLVPVENWPVKIAGMTVTLSGPVNQSTKSSGGGSFSFKEIPAGDYLITVTEWNYGMTKQNFTAPSGKAIKIVLKGSCPFLYVWTGESYEKENDIYSVARVTPHDLLTEEGKELASRDRLFLQQVSLERIPEHLKKERAYRDHYRITKTLKPDKEGYYRLKIKEQAHEHSFTDVAELLAVDHKPGAKVGVTRDGKVFLFEETSKFALTPSTGEDKGGGAQRTALYNGEGVDLTLPREAFTNGVLAVTWQGFQDGEGKGRTFSPGRPRLSLQRKDPTGEWQTVDWIYPRDETEQAFLVLEDKVPGWDEGGSVRLVATSCDPEKYHRIDRIEWAKRSQETPLVASLPLMSAIKSDGEDALKQLKRADGESLLLRPDEEVALKFRATDLRKGFDRTVIFISEGFYIPMPLVQLARAE